MLPLNQGIIKVPPEILSDHCATYVYVPFEYPLHGTFTRNAWRYKDANYEMFNEKRERKLIISAYCMSQKLRGAPMLLFGIGCV